MKEHEQRQFVDTNVLVYAHDSSAGIKHEKAKELVISLWENRNGCISIQVLQEFYVTVTRKITNPLPSGTALQIINDLANWRVHCPGVEDVIRAIGIQQTYKISFWDAMIICSAGSLECKQLWTEDLSTGQEIEGIITSTPF